MSRGVISLACASVVALLGCARAGVVDDGTSVSWGASNGGLVLHPARLPDRGEDYRVPEKWRARGMRYGTDEMIGMLVHAARQVGAAFPGARLGIADIGGVGGGPSAHHHSHQSGRDVDLLFYTVDRRGRVTDAQDMYGFAEGAGASAGFAASSGGGSGEGGSGIAGSAASLSFDVPRNWALVRALVQNPIAEVQFIFIFDELRQRLLDFAVASGESDDVITHAAAVLQQPGDSAPHDDHFHVRIYCSPADRAEGCIDRGDLRWTKKLAKHGSEHDLAAVAPRLRATLGRPLPAMLVLGRLPFSP